MDFAEAQQLRWEQLHLLKQIYEEGHISKIEYESRKRQIIDELTDTTAYPTSNNNNDVMLSSSRIEHDDEDESEEKVLLSPNSPGLRLRPPSFAHHHDSFGSSISSSSISTTASSTNSNLSVASAPARAPLSPSAYYEGSSMIPGSYYREGELPIPVLRKHRMSLNQPPSNLNSGGAVAGAGGRPHKHRRPCRKDVVPEDLSFPIVAHEPPKFEHIQHEKAIRYTIMLDQKKWQKSKCKVKIDEIPFARGGLRIVYHLWDEEQKSNMVAKVSMNAKEKSDKRAYATDIHVQALAKQYADGFNSYDPPKKVDFLIPYLLELVERPGHPICAVEPYISGPYIKYNNNDGFVVSQEIDRNTPQAFSHYTYEASSHSLLICDIQGVNDIYTVMTNTSSFFG
eukprot:TRINITY_DN5970_c0_g1_i2.p1 TRINITY_DN5970_c0_g1~~TRINITY_DN5970_c0_g1_i2.p1  ORF type:complete len:397 (+),score=83.61 TRINITY_DN5970_c0_g1_i2:54-1244(+)